jgi:hypothetical protein
MNSFFTWHTFLEVGKTQDLPSKIWQTLGDALSPFTGWANYFINVHKYLITSPSGHPYPIFG